jgi:hypothetical protein
LGFRDKSCAVSFEEVEMFEEFEMFGEFSLTRNSLNPELFKLETL